MWPRVYGSDGDQKVLRTGLEQLAETLEKSGILDAGWSDNGQPTPELLQAMLQMLTAAIGEKV